MTQEDKWTAKYDEVVAFIKTNHRNPSRYDSEERGTYCNWIKHQRKKLNAGVLKLERVERLRELLGLMAEYQHKNQYK